jgi:L-threonylcarbamoyladenylate synthase
MAMKEEIGKCLKILRNGGTIVYPTDTIWGIGCDATNPAAVDKVFRLKRRAESKSLIVLLDHPDKLDSYITNMPEITRDLLNSVDKPLTIIYPGGKNLAGNLMAEDGSVAIRIVRNRFCCALISAFGKPIVSTSANLSGEAPPTSFRSISPDIIRGAGYVVNEILEEVHEPKASRIIRLLPGGEFQVVRE